MKEFKYMKIPTSIENLYIVDLKVKLPTKIPTKIPTKTKY